MVCPRCILTVEQTLTSNGLKFLSVRLGEAILQDAPSKEELDNLSEDLKNLGFEILDDRRQKLIEEIKSLLIQKVQTGEIEEHFSMSDFLTKKLNKEYTQLSRLFSEVEGITLEQYFILQKIEKVKELLVYDELNLSEISYRLGYSSLAHLSAQFKKSTGLTPSEFKKLGISHRKSIDDI